MDTILAILESIGKAHLIAIFLIFVSFVIEKLTPAKLFFDNYKWKKSPRNVEILSNGDTGYYIILILIVLVYDYFQGKFELTFFSGIFIFILFNILAPIFYKVHKKYQAIDPEKSDDDYS